jgi:hypothetical protein
MALLARYGGADDVRLCNNQILANQAGAEIPSTQPKTKTPAVLVEVDSTSTLDSTSETVTNTKTRSKKGTV